MGLLSSLSFGRNNALSAKPVPGVILEEQETLLENFPGPAFILDEDCQLVEGNLSSVPLLNEMGKQTDGKFRSAVKGVLTRNRSEHFTFTYGTDDVIEVFDLTLLPLSGGGVLVTGKDVSMQRNLTNALVASRQLFKDLVTCTAEFVWETDEYGCFRYVSPRGAIGFTAAELDGRLARDLIIPSEDDEADALTNPFESAVPVEDEVIWLRDRSSALACMRISSIPVFDDAGSHIGCRGAGRDITFEMEQRSQFEKMAAQEKVFSKIIDAIRHEIDPARLFEIAGRGACDALNSTRMMLTRKNSSGSLEMMFKSGINDEVEAAFLNWMRHQTTVETDGLTELESGDWRLFIAPIQSNSQLDGAVALVRRKEATELEEGENRLMRLLSEHLGVALIQIKARETLEQLSRTDELSGLLNRRAFHEDVEKRLKTRQRSKGGNALFYIDLDNFKPVNDRFGHEKGDEVLKGVSQLLAEHSRVGDMVARLGGDEFAMWLEDIPRDKTIEKAEHLQKLCQEMSGRLNVLDPSLSFSIGIALTDGQDNETLDSLLARADAAMYKVKARGKGAFSIADAVEKVEQKDA
ncbi:sensor domain-containing diguanylate cyclase [Sneathiella aquimaris]|uniref:sensor domain-containing diguanylate cyclase n=1 Tax=Sneathiella aquimaris TaxID=2599305 RepID=UPI00146DB2FB|nr:sensor domain-containing diguanylate cyclase [Sneathiella aquimaris]